MNFHFEFNDPLTISPVTVIDCLYDGQWAQKPVWIYLYKKNCCEEKGTKDSTQWSIITGVRMKTFWTIINEHLVQDQPYFLSFSCIFSVISKSESMKRKPKYFPLVTRKKSFLDISKIPVQFPTKEAFQWFREPSQQHLVYKFLFQLIF